MKIYRYTYRNKAYWGALKEDVLFEIKGSVFRKFETKKEGVPISKVILLPPAEPTKTFQPDAVSLFSVCPLPIQLPLFFLLAPLTFFR